MITLSCSLAYFRVKHLWLVCYFGKIKQEWNKCSSTIPKFVKKADCYSPENLVFLLVVVFSTRWWLHIEFSLEAKRTVDFGTCTFVSGSSSSTSRPLFCVTWICIPGVKILTSAFMSDGSGGDCEVPSCLLERKGEFLLCTHDSNLFQIKFIEEDI